MAPITGPAAASPSSATSSGTPMKPAFGKAATSAPKAASRRSTPSWPRRAAPGQRDDSDDERAPTRDRRRAAPGRRAARAAGWSRSETAGRAARRTAVGVQARNRALANRQARRDPAEQDQGEERTGHRQDGLHGGSIARRLGASANGRARVGPRSRKLVVVFALRPCHVSGAPPVPAAPLFRCVWRVTRRQPACRSQPAVPADPNDRRDRAGQVGPGARSPTRPRSCCASTARSPSRGPGTLRSTALDQVRGEALQKIQLRDIPRGARGGRRRSEDHQPSSLVLDEMRPTGFSTVREVAAAIDRFKASGKKVVAWGSVLRRPPVLHRGRTPTRSTCTRSAWSTSPASAA